MADKTPIRINDASSFQMAIDEKLRTPLYYQIYVLIRDKILSGTYPNGALIPTEKQLEQTFNVSRITVKRALDELAKEGLVSRQRGRGTMVTFSAPVSSSLGNMDGLLEDMLNIVLETKVQILEFDYVTAAPHVTDALKLSPDAKVQHAVRTRYKDETPFSYVITYVPEDIGRSFKRTDLKDQPILALIEKSGVSISRARQTVTATLADGTTAPALNIGIGSPLLKVSRIVYDTDDRPVEYIIIYYWPGLYRINMELSRMQHGGDGGSTFWAMNMK